MDMDVETMTKARNDLATLCAAFDVETPPLGAEGRVLLLLSRGSLSYDESERRCTYTLGAPLKLKNGDTFSSFSFGEPNQSDIDLIQKGIDIEGDLGQINLMLSRVLTRLCGVSLGVADRFMRRDVSDLKEIFGLLRFFG